MHKITPLVDWKDFLVDAVGQNGWEGSKRDISYVKNIIAHLGNALLKKHSTSTSVHDIETVIV
jgi:hypothetical protein